MDQTTVPQSPSVFSKKPRAVILIFLIVTFLGVVLILSKSGNTGNKKATPSANPSVSPAVNSTDATSSGLPEMSLKGFKGVVTGASGNAISAKSDQGQDMDFRTDQNTIYFTQAASNVPPQKAESGKIPSIKAGDSIIISYQGGSEGKNLATSVLILAPR